MQILAGLKSNALTAIVYFGLMAAGLALRPDDYYFTVFAPAAGLGVAAAVFRPKFSLPGVLFAAVVSPFVLFNLTAEVIPQHAQIAVWMNIFIALTHPLLSLWLLRRFSANLHNFYDVKQLAKVILITGPFSAALVFAMAIGMRAMMPLSEDVNFPYPALFGWMGYSLGVFVIYPMAALLLHKGSLDRSVLRSPLMLQFLLAFVAIIFIFSKIHQSDDQRIMQDFRTHAEHVAEEFRHVFEREVEALSATKGLFVATDYVSREKFNVFASHITKNNTSIAALEWVPNVSDAKRKEFVSQARREQGNIDFAITEKNAQGKMQVASKRERYFPVFYVYPFSGNERAYGYDLASNPVRYESMLVSASNDELIASPPLRLVQGDNDIAVLIFQPVFRKTQKEKNLQNTEGFILGVFKLKNLFDPVLRRNDTQLTLQIKDEIDGQVMYQSEGFAQGSVHSFTTTMRLLGRIYRISVSHSALFMSTNHNWLINFLSALGLFILGIFSLFLLVRTRRNEYAENLVRQQTTELRLINEDKQRKNDLLASLSRSQADFISNTSTYAVFHRLTMDVLQLTRSKFGFIIELEKDFVTTQAFHVHAVAANTQDQPFSYKNDTSKTNIESIYLQHINRVVSSSRPLVAKLHAADSQQEDDSDWNIFLGVPIFIGEKIVGVVGLSGRDEGYNATIIQYLEPFIGTCSSFIHAMRVALARSKAESFVLEQESRLRAQFDNANDTIISFDEFGVIDSVNPAGEKLSGYAADDLIGKHLALLFPDCCGKQLGQGISMNLLSMRGLQESMLHTWHAELIPVEISTNQIEMPGSNLYCSVIRDLSERHKVDRLKNEFVATVSHELRTPLTSIQGALKLVNSGVLEKNANKQKELLDIAQNNAERLLLLVNDLLDMEKIESGKLELFSESLDLMQILRQTHQQMDSYAQKFDVCLKILRHPSQAMVMADANRLAQIIANLLSNAIKFTEKDTQVEIWVEESQDYFRLSVRDYGPGIAEQFKQRLFEKFTQADGSSSRKQAGSGLGLSISKQLIELMGGRIAFINAYPGAQFFIDVPKGEADRSDSMSLRSRRTGVQEVRPGVYRSR